MKKLILASQSPRRKQLLEQVRIPFSVSSSNVDESYPPHLSPSEIVQFLAKKKARSVLKENEDAVVLGSDTVVVLDEKILGKPNDETEAKTMLKKLSGRTHSVVTGVAIVSSKKEAVFSVESLVTFYDLTEEEIDFYIRTREPFDKAGAYGIQGIGAFLVKEIQGDYFSIVGLPVARTVRELKKFGITPMAE